MARRFLLLGCTSYMSRGDEAIARGTVTILRREFGNDLEVTLASSGRRHVIARQGADESDPAVRHVALEPGLISRPYWAARLNKLLHTRMTPQPTMLAKPLDAAEAALMLAADNYSLDYGIPRRYIELGHYVQKRGVPLVLWGASVGPFDAEPEFEKEMLDHLSALPAILVRDSMTERYLRDAELNDKVFRVADPAFLMEAVEPPPGKLGFDMPEGAVGLNLNALFIRRLAGGDVDAFARRCAEIVVAVGRETERDIVLIPHGCSMDIQNDDHRLTQRVLQLVSKQAPTRVLAVGDNLNAQESKWVISQCAVFAGGRMHSVVAALSSGVPALSFAYSLKARGLHEDVFGSDEFCLDYRHMRADSVAQRVKAMIDDEAAIRRRLAAVLPGIRDRALEAGTILRRVIG